MRRKRLALTIDLPRSMYSIESVTRREKQDFVLYLIAVMAFTALYHLSGSIVGRYTAWERKVNNRITDLMRKCGADISSAMREIAYLLFLPPMRILAA